MYRVFLQHLTLNPALCFKCRHLCILTLLRFIFFQKFGKQSQNHITSSSNINAFQIFQHTPFKWLKIFPRLNDSYSLHTSDFSFSALMSRISSFNQFMKNHLQREVWKSQNGMLPSRTCWKLFSCNFHQLHIFIGPYRSGSFAYFLLLYFQSPNP